MHHFCLAEALLALRTQSDIFFCRPLFFRQMSSKSPPPEPAQETQKGSSEQSKQLGFEAPAVVPEPISKKRRHTFGGGCAAVDVGSSRKAPHRKPIKTLMHILTQYEELGAGRSARSIVKRKTGYMGRLPSLQKRAQKELWDLLPCEYRNDTSIPKFWKALLKSTPPPDDFLG